jgi:hypothetical protein
MDDVAVDLELDRPHSARMYDYYLGGSTNFPADREAVGRIMAVFPQVLAAARANRAFMHRSTRYLAEHGIRQFLDIGTGIPTSPNLHEIAQSVAPDARIVYADNDPIVLAHAQALLRGTAEGRTAYLEADLTDAKAILASPVLHETLDLSRPVALSINAVLHFITDEFPVYDIVEQLKAPLAPGSAMAISHGTADFAPEIMEHSQNVYRAAVSSAAQSRTREQVARFFDGWEMAEPGLTASHRWHPDPGVATAGMTDVEAACHVGVAFKLP